MNLLALVRGESATLRRDLVVGILVAAIGDAGVLIFVNAATARPESRGRFLTLFLCAVALYVVGLRFGYAAVHHLVGDAVHSIRLRVARKVQNAGLAAIERTGSGVIYDAVARETTTIVETGEIIATTLHAMVLVACATIYVAFLSRPALAVIIAFIAVCIGIVNRNRAATSQMMERITAHEIDYLGVIGDALDGFKESALNARRRRDLLAHLDDISRQLSKLKLQTADVYHRIYLFTQYSVYLLIGIIVFALPYFLPLPATRVTQLTMSILFVIAPLTTIIGSIPDIARAEVAATTVTNVELALGAAAERTGGADIDFAGFETISLAGLRYTHRGEEGETFTVGPIDWTLRRGTMVFIVGGNGSGKSTFLQMLTGLYPADTGRIVAAAREIGPAELPSYRALFSTIFGEFHLFERLYAAERIDVDRAADLLRVMQLDAKTSIEGDRFTNLSLSTGQRKRLALIVCLLENRPVLILDELAADQDPEFRAFLYESLLPRLRSEGRTIVAVTHDDRWFAAADEVWKMEYGRLEQLGVRSHGR